MTQQVINIGSAPDDGTGDPLRTSFNKTNQNFTELYAVAGAPVGAEYITSTADATLTAERVLTDTATVTWDRTTAGQIKANAAGGTATPVPPQGRLTLQTATPVMTTTQAAKTAIFFTPYVGNQIVLYNGTTMTPTTFAELTIATTDTTQNAAAIGASKCNDWFVWGSPLKLSHGPDWTSDTVRSAGTALVMVNGILLNNATIGNGTTTGPAAQRGTYVGTTRSNASSQLDWIYGVNGAPPTAGFFGVGIDYIRVFVAALVGDTTATWTYSTAVWQAARNQATARVSYVVGLSEDPIDALYDVGMTVSAAGGVNAIAGIGINTTTAFSGFTAASSVATLGGAAVATYRGIPGLGFNFVSAIEYASGPTATYFGSIGVAYFQSGLSFRFRM